MLQEIATLSDGMATASMQNSNYFASYLAVAKPGGAAESSALNGEEYIMIPHGECFITSDSGVTTMTAVSSTSKHPEEAMQLLNLMYTDEALFNMLMFGLEDVHYTKVADNRIEPIEGANYTYGTMAWAYGNQLLAWYLPGQVDGLWETTEEILNNAEVSLLRGFSFDLTPVQSEIAQIDAVRTEYSYRDYVATDLAAFESEYTEKLKAAGIETLVAEFQRQVDEWAAAVGLK